MSTPRITMRQIRQVLRLHLDAGLPYAKVARALGLPKSAVGKFALLARAAGVDWAVAQTLTDQELEARLYRSAVPRAAHHLEPDYALIHQELKRPGVTLQLLWKEYAQANALAYKYTSFCIKYRAWALGLKRSMRQTHIAGDKLFVDYDGDTVPIVDAATGEIRQAQIFVAALGASSYTYACATMTQTAPDWVASIMNALEFIGGVPRLVVPDQPRAVVARPDRYEPGLGRLVEEFCDHYSVAMLPARPARPKDKPKVEVAVQIVQRWILARLRNRRFFSLGELNCALADLLADLNQRPFKKLPGCRREAFEKLDKPALRALPPARMPIVRFKSARVNIDYHVDLGGHYYSVPHRLVRTTVELRIAGATLEIFAGQQRVAVHPVSTAKGKHSTISEHMPASHRAHLEWTPAKLIAWGERIGVGCAALVRWQMDNRPHPGQGYRCCLGLQRLARQHGHERLEAACTRAMAIHSPIYRSVNSILASGTDRQPLPAQSTQTSLPLHENVRGPDYYH
ncbi:IS21 family transposase [Verminephrobacter eiseniae]|nr:IS21 family transposase [Verminephrobacter eiseniae]MCW5285870.1 IS21 family transposase [Verminephrobacter eiseniae]MCW5304168.1 IS21 family transposase [Verminephrobacter eiseniae]MCW8180637.1 IS21 family transposase [Verminephrobacter eiseniae]MCW8192094.1 IS21 family transposase [Verminephrobacter eiseniae]